jgi:hypothetical protein
MLEQVAEQGTYQPSGDRGRAMSGKRNLRTGIFTVLILVIAVLGSHVSIAIQSIRFDLRMIGEGYYEARMQSGKWPTCVADLEGTAYLNLPQRKSILEDGHFVVVWQGGLDADPNENAERVLAYDNGSLLCRFGWVWVCRGDLRTEYVRESELRRLLSERKE